MNLKKELPSLTLIALPYLYIMMIWNNLPDKVPIHWNAMGEIDGFGSRYTLLILPLLLPGLIYITFSLIQRFTPIDKIAKMGRKFGSLKFLLILFMSVLCLLIIHSSKEGLVGQPTFIFISLGLLFALFGNFSRTIQPNYFLGIRTPWTLKSEQVWKSTHELAGKLWFAGGLIIALIALISSSKYAISGIIGIVAVITLIPIIYSYLKFKELTKK